MNKPIIIGAGVTLAALGITPYFIGNGIEQNVTDIVTELNKQAVYSANIKSYQKGWFSTTAEIEIGIDVNSLVAAQQMGNSNLSPEDNPSITATLVAHHGPLYFGNGQGIGRAHYTVSINGDKLREYAQWDATKPAYVNEGVIGLFGGISYTDEIPAMTATDEESGINFLFSGYKGEATTQGEEVVYKSTGESLSIGADEFSVNMKSLSECILSIINTSQTSLLTAGSSFPCRRSWHTTGCSRGSSWCSRKESWVPRSQVSNP